MLRAFADSLVCGTFVPRRKGAFCETNDSTAWVGPLVFPFSSGHVEPGRNSGSMRPDRLCCGELRQPQERRTYADDFAHPAAPWGAHVLEIGRHRRRGSAAGP
jgi:hypothetical protein